MLQFKFFIVISLILFALAILLCFLFPYFVGAPFEPMPKSIILKIPKFARLKKSDKIVDLGSGKGDVLVELAKKGYNIVGYEINPFLFLYTKLRLKLLEIKNAKVYFGNFWNKDLSQFNVVIVFQIGYIMNKLEKKLRRELDNSKVISYYWKFKGLKEKKVDESGRMHLYLVNEKRKEKKIK